MSFPVDLVHILAIFGLLYGLCKLLDTWLLETQRRRIDSFLSELKEHSLENALNTVKLPLQFTQTVLDFLLGPDVRSKTSIIRSSFLGGFLLLACLGFAGVQSETFFGIKNTPWDEYNSSVELLRDIKEHADEERQSESNIDEFTASGRDIDDVWIFRLLHILEVGFVKWLYLICFIVLVPIAATFAFCWSLTNTRRIITALLETESPYLFTGSIAYCIIKSIAIAILLFLFLNALSSPATALLVLGFPLLLFGDLSIIGFFLLAGLAGFGVFLLSTTWINTISLGVVLPGILLCLVVAATRILYPFRSIIRDVFVSTLSRALSHKNGSVLFFGATFGSIFAIIAALQQLLLF